MWFNQKQQRSSVRSTVAIMFYTDHICNVSIYASLIFYIHKYKSAHVSSASTRLDGTAKVCYFIAQDACKLTLFFYSD